MSRLILRESLSAIAIIILTVLLLDPFMFWMPSPMLVTVLLLVVVAYTIFATFIWKERIKDEREERHRNLSARISFLSGSGIIILGVIYESLVHHQVDTWLVAALIVMVTTKIVSASYYAHKN